MGTIYVKYPFGLSVFSSSSHLFTDRLISEARSSKQRHDNDILCVCEHLIFWYDPAIHLFETISVNAMLQ